MNLRSDFKCSRCGNEELIYDSVTGEVICGECGLVLKEEHFVESLLPEGIENKETKRATISSDSYRKIKRLSLLDKRARLEEEGPQSLREAMFEVNKLVEDLYLPNRVRERAQEIYRDAQKKGLIIGGTIAAFVAAAVYAACREIEIPRTLNEVADISSSEIKEVSRSYRVLLMKLGLRMPIDEPTKYISKMASLVGLSREAEILSIEILERARERKVLAGKDPRGIAAAALYMACKFNDEECTQASVAEAAGVSEVTLRKRLRGLEKIMEND